MEASFPKELYEELAKFMNDLVYAPVISHEFPSYRISVRYHFHRLRYEIPVHTEYVEHEGTLPALGRGYGPKFGTEILRCIERAVEKFRKNKMPLVDGLSVLCEMRNIAHYMLLFVVSCMAESQEIRVSQYSAPMSN